MNELNSLLKSISSQIKGKRETKKIAISKEGIIWTPVDLVKTSFPEKRVETKDWLRQFERYSLNIHQSISDRPLPYGILAREIFEYFFNEYVKRYNNNEYDANKFTFQSIADFFNKVKGQEHGTKVSTPQRVLALEMLLAFESTCIRFKEDLDPENNYYKSTNKFFFDTYVGPDHPKIDQKPENISNGEVIIYLEEKIFNRLAESKKVPIQQYLLKLAGENVTARDLSQFISYQCNSLYRRGEEMIEIHSRDLRRMLGKEEYVGDKDFNKSLKRAMTLLIERYEIQNPEDTFPANLVSKGRGKVYLQIFIPKVVENILCA